MYPSCSFCGFQPKSHTNLITVIDGKPLCMDCFEKRRVETYSKKKYCSECGDAIVVLGQIGDKLYCDTCFGKAFENGYNVEA